MIVLLGVFSCLFAQTRRNKYIVFKRTKSLEFTAFGETESDQVSTSLINSDMHIYSNREYAMFYFGESRVPAHLMLYCFLIRISYAISNRSLH